MTLIWPLWRPKLVYGLSLGWGRNTRPWGETLCSPELKGFKSDLMETMMYVKMEFSFPFLSFQKGRMGGEWGESGGGVGGGERETSKSKFRPQTNGPSVVSSSTRLWWGLCFHLVTQPGSWSRWLTAAEGRPLYSCCASLPAPRASVSGPNINLPARCKRLWFAGAAP